MTRTTLALGAATALALAGAALVPAGDAPPPAALPRHDAPPSPTGNVVVALCDGETTAEIPGVREGETPTRAQAEDVAGRLMAAWKEKNPRVAWEDGRLAQAEPREGAAAAAGDAAARRQAADAPGGATGGGAGGLPSGGQGDLQRGHTYGAFTERDEKIWQIETEQFVREGHRVFHDANAFGGTIGVSCDMCHPDAANTHPETYPKFQVQIGRVALLRDMINWCIQNPTRGKPLAENDPRLKAMEAYILAQRKGTAIDYGKH
jgi:hypothetical protein